MIMLATNKRLQILCLCYTRFVDVTTCPKMSKCFEVCLKILTQHICGCTTEEETGEKNDGPKTVFLLFLHLASPECGHQPDHSCFKLSPKHGETEWFSASCPQPQIPTTTHLSLPNQFLIIASYIQVVVSINRSKMTLLSSSIRLSSIIHCSVRN